MDALGHDLPEEVKLRILSFDQHPTATLIKTLQFTYHKPTWRTNTWYPSIKLRVSTCHDRFYKRGRRPVRGDPCLGDMTGYFLTPQPERNPSPRITHCVRELNFGPYSLDQVAPNHFGTGNVITDSNMRWVHNIEDGDVSEVSKTPDDLFSEASDSTDGESNMDEDLARPLGMDARTSDQHFTVETRDVSHVVSAGEV